MCPVAFTVASALASSLGAVVSGQAQSAAMRAKADQYRTQAQLDNRQANLTQIQGQYEQRRKTEQLDNAISGQRAGYAAQGVDMSGTASDVIVNSRREGALDIDAIRYGTDVKSSNLRYSSAINQTNAIAADNAASAAETATIIGAITPLIGAGAKLAGVPNLGGSTAANSTAVDTGPLRINQYAPDYLKRTRLGLKF